MGGATALLRLVARRNFSRFAPGLMNLLLHARLGNVDYLSYALRPAERKFEVAERSSAGERFSLTVFRQWLNG
ncbi:hypothetical protein SD10_12985 [Spirosoma radiotolerans]|uniref:Uncharacterized protein n=1 Tax=Spirosoma radiotolerans TaxID=1379870 RepID=A0A0E3ZV99_9BACT|nr:hypothetical protein SD10_12985 [Spirosoma radiotolerans]